MGGWGRYERYERGKHAQVADRQLHIMYVLYAGVLIDAGESTLGPCRISHRLVNGAITQYAQQLDA